MHNFDVKRERRMYYTAKRDTFEVLDVPEMTFLMADGKGNPNTADGYRTAVEALYSTSYAVRAIAKEELDRQHTVGPLEGLWWADDLRVFESRDGDEWNWSMMIVQPDWITRDVVDAALERVRNRKDLEALDRLRFDTFAEGMCVQVLHVGPYDEEAPTIKRMHEEYIPAHKLALRGRHHEIYLGDPRRAAPSKLRTILRQPVHSAGS
jgi:hypothetical protein